MTTGRINQVTDDRPRRARPDAVETPSSPRPPVGTPRCWEQPRRVAEPNQRKIVHRQSHGHRPTVPTIGASRPTERPTYKNLEGYAPSGGPRNEYRPHSTNNTPEYAPSTDAEDNPTPARSAEGSTIPTTRKHRLRRPAIRQFHKDPKNYREKPAGEFDPRHRETDARPNPRRGGNLGITVTESFPKPHATVPSLAGLFPSRPRSTDRSQKNTNLLQAIYVQPNPRLDGNLGITVTESFPKPHKTVSSRPACQRPENANAGLQESSLVD